MTGSASYALLGVLVLVPPLMTSAKAINSDSSVMEAIPDDLEQSAVKKSSNDYANLERILAADDGASGKGANRQRAFTENEWRLATRLANKELIDNYLRSLRHGGKSANFNRAAPVYGNLDFLRMDGPRKRWHERGSRSPNPAEVRFPIPERRTFPEVDWRGFNEDVFHESFGDFNPMKRWKLR